MKSVWILEKGEHCEGGHVLGVFTSKELAFDSFVREVQVIDRTFTLKELSGDPTDGSVYASGGCDWLSLSEYLVTATPQLTG